MSEMTLGALATAGVLAIGDGYRTRQAELTSDGFRIIRVADVKDGRITLDSPDFVDGAFEKQIGAKVATEGDVLLTTKGTVGRVAIVPKGVSRAVYSPQLCWFRVLNPEVIDGRYLSYWLQSPAFTSQSSHMQGNSDMAPYVSLSDLRSSRITVPLRSEQQGIAEVLGALDDKIASNTALASKIEDLVQARYRTIAPRSRYTGTRFADVAQISGGGTPSTSDASYWDGKVWWATPTDMTALAGPYLDSTSRTITEAGLEACSSKLFQPGAILMTSRATIGVLAVNIVATAVNQGFIVVQPNDERLRWWIFHQMRARADEFLSWANGATFLELSRGNFKQLPFLTPPDGCLDQFAVFAESLHARARAALEENGSLAATRDTLLPHLMSGKLRVRDAEAAASAAGA